MKSSNLILSRSRSDAAERLLSVLDRVGACASTACALHCILLPFLITALPFVGLSVLASSAFELSIIVLSVTLATLSFCWGSRLHGEWRTLLFLLAAVMLFLFGHDIEGPMHWVVMGIGGFALAAGHLVNRRLCRSCKECEDH
ncbi:MAG: MerC domain-containing protein [Proteobacteria bacterium]|nr:MerC domain-containing protein [Pseudomonadota bacterium]